MKFWPSAREIRTSDSGRILKSVSTNFSNKTNKFDSDFNFILTK